MGIGQSTLYRGDFTIVTASHPLPRLLADIQAI